MDLIAGLGNPGPKYRNTRHNVGFQVINLLSRELGVRLLSRRFQSRNKLTKYKGKEVVLLRPTTFMNLCGKSIKACADYFQLEAKCLLIVHDDLDLPIGRIKVVTHGGTGGHKGIQSIIDYLHNSHFSRVKIGIGRPQYKETIEEYVLSPFYDDQKRIMEKTIHQAVLACRLFISDGVESVMSQVNRREN